MNENISTIQDLLAYAADRFGEKDCIRYVSEKTIRAKTYRQMYDDSRKAAGDILRTVPSRAHVALIGKTSYSFITYYNGIFISGNTAVPIAPETPAEEIAFLLEKADVSAIVFDDSVKEKAESIARENGYALIHISDDFNGAEERPLSAVDPDACALIMYTSGTTGDKKGVMLSSRALVSNVLFREMSYEGEHVALNVLPMHHIFSFSCDYLKNLKDGVTICLNGDVGNIGENLLLFEPTFIRLVPMMIEALLKRTKIILRRNPGLSYREAAERVFGRRLRSVIASGAYLDPQIAAEYEKMGISVRQGYGMTETGPRIAVPNGRTGIESAGAVIDICEIRLRDGEIQVRSPSLMLGYYKEPEATAVAFTEDGWFMTGDIGYLDEERRLYITGRKKNLIILSNGENVSPEEIEKRFAELPYVGEVLVYGANDRLTAEFYVSAEYLEKHTEEAAQNEIYRAAEQYNLSVVSEKEISEIRFRKEPFEKTSSGKIKRASITF